MGLSLQLHSAGRSNQNSMWVGRLQDDGAHDKHWIGLDFQEKIAVHGIRLLQAPTPRPILTDDGQKVEPDLQSVAEVVDLQYWASDGQWRTRASFTIDSQKVMLN